MRPTAIFALACALSGAGCARLGASSAEARIDIRGSDSEVNLVQRLAEIFMGRNPEVFVSVTGGGSGVGIAALIDGTCDIANSSRRLHPEEKLLALRNGVDPHLTVFATDALTLVVHEDNPIEVLDIPTVGALYRGDIERWTEIGGPDARVVTYGRQSSSGTYAWFRENAVQGEYDPSTRQMTGTAQIVDAVARDPGGIGYVAVGYLKAGARGVKPLLVRRSPGSEPIDPLNDDAVLEGAYPISRPLYQITNGPPEGAVKDFIELERSPLGQKIIMSMGFFPPLRTASTATTTVEPLRVGDRDGS